MSLMGLTEAAAAAAAASSLRRVSGGSSSGDAAVAIITPPRILSRYGCIQNMQACPVGGPHTM